MTTTVTLFPGLGANPESFNLFSFILSHFNFEAFLLARLFSLFIGYDCALEPTILKQ
jgi:hypothetical protein